MMFLLRAAFWVGLVLVLLPTGSKKSSGDEPQIKVSEAASAATAAVGDLSQFCSRQPESCTVGSQVAVAIGQRVEGGAKFIYDYITERRDAAGQHDAATQTASLERRPSDRPETTGSVAVGKATPVVLLPRPRPMHSQDTLTASDRRPAWRGPKLRQEAELKQPI
jgi:hypothetical protein